MTQTITRLFDSHRDAVDAVAGLEALGVPPSAIGLVADDSEHPVEQRSFAPSGGGAGAGEMRVGDLLGDGDGVLAGLGMMAAPDVGPVVAAGWLTATLLGAADLTGGLAAAGVGEEEARLYVEGLRRGGALVSVRVGETDVLDIEAVLENCNGLDARNLSGARPSRSEPDGRGGMAPEMVRTLN